jgi:tight adherence protein C
MNAMMWTQLSISFLAAISTVCIGAALMLLIRVRRESRVARTRVLQEDRGFAPSDQVDRSRPSELQESMRRLGEALSRQGVSNELRKSLASAGIYSPSGPAVYLGYKALMFALGFAVLTAVLLPLHMDLVQRVLLISSGSALMFFLPNLILAGVRTRRRAEVQRHLPDAVDMLEICVSSGMGLDAAWNNVAEEVRKVSAVLADEMELTNLEINLGLGRAAAMRHMAERTNVADISSLVALLIQAERFGASVVQALKVYADTLRELRRQRAEEAAEKAAVKLLFPMVLFVFPPLLMVMVGPALLGLFQTLR